MTITPFVLTGLTLVMTGAVVRTIHQLRTVWRDPDSLAASHHLVRAIRAFILVACCAVFIAAAIWSSKTLLVIGAIILAEELYETGVALLILRSERTAG